MRFARNTVLIDIPVYVFLQLRERGSDYDRLKERHDVHHHFLGLICDELAKRNIDYKVCQRWDYTPEAINWADAVFAAGGDGTFLLAASRIRSQSKPLIGVNTDPSSSEGFLCLTKKLSEQFLFDAFERLFNGEFKWLWRQRIRVTLTGQNAYDAPMELHDQQLMYPEYRWAEHVREQEDARFRSHVLKPATDCSSLDMSNREEVFLSSELDGLVEPSNVLPFLALNDVYIGESLSSRVSYYELQIDSGPMVKQKSSGITLCTGTGSTSWYFNINKMTEQCLKDLLHIGM
ncbi:unnamed protein product [Soboliphyme baturini]|uniref:NAD(+) kinase n=1 Tax=Soboliphyme baturini TaxID=241478 RepID=A0A183IJ75_9BILA|nr:unnamed protein product [Soboliphyme baturini]